MEKLLIMCVQDVSQSLFLSLPSSPDILIYRYVVILQFDRYSFLPKADHSLFLVFAFFPPLSLSFFCPSRPSLLSFSHFILKFKICSKYLKRKLFGEYFFSRFFFLKIFIVIEMFLQNS